jgi:hypothetical protein
MRAGRRGGSDCAQSSGGTTYIDGINTTIYYRKSSHSHMINHMTG